MAGVDDLFGLLGDMYGGDIGTGDLDLTGFIDPLFAEYPLGDIADIPGININDLINEYAPGSQDTFNLDQLLGEYAPGQYGDEVSNVPGGPSGTSLSDRLRSQAGGGPVKNYGGDPFNAMNMADPTNSINSAGRDWL